jgi:hypothetical protein
MSKEVVARSVTAEMKLTPVRIGDLRKQGTPLAENLQEF